jgi:hypothetical protein
VRKICRPPKIIKRHDIVHDSLIQRFKEIILDAKNYEVLQKTTRSGTQSKRVLVQVPTKLRSRDIYLDKQSGFKSTVRELLQYQHLSTIGPAFFFGVWFTVVHGLAILRVMSN